MELIRDALRGAVAQDTLRGVAKVVDMSPTGLQGFLDGAQPYGKTKVKLRLWYALHSDDSEAGLPDETAVGLVDALLREIPDSRRAAARDRVLSAFTAAFEAAAVPPPTWAHSPGSDRGGRVPDE